MLLGWFRRRRERLAMERYAKILAMAQASEARRREEIAFWDRIIAQNKRRPIGMETRLSLEQAHPSTDDYERRRRDDDAQAERDRQRGQREDDDRRSGETASMTWGD